MITRNTSCRVATALLFTVMASGALPATAAQAANHNSRNAQSKGSEKRAEKAHMNSAYKSDNAKEVTALPTPVTETPSTATKKPAFNDKTQSNQHVKTQSNSHSVAPSKPVNNGTSSAQKNQVSYWEALGYGICVKYDGLSGKTFSVPGHPKDASYSLAVVKSGSSQSVANPNETDVTVASKDILRHSSGKDISHVILCSTESTAANPQAPAKPTNPGSPSTPAKPETPTPTTPNEPGQVLSGESTTRQNVLPSTLPKTGIGYIGMVIAFLASAVSYVGAFYVQKRRLMNQ